MLNRRAAIVPDIYDDDRVPVDAYRPTFVRSLVMVPVRASDPLGAIGGHLASPHEASAEEVEVLQALAELRTRTEQAERLAAEVARLASTDPLTGVLNRRGFLDELRRRRAPGPGAVFAFVDVDGLTDVDDRLGHDAGDEVIAAAGRVIRRAVGLSGCVGRWGRDEFVVYVIGVDPSTLHDRIEAGVLECADRTAAPVRLSTGVVGDDGTRRPDDLIAAEGQAPEGRGLIRSASPAACSWASLNGALDPGRHDGGVPARAAWDAARRRRPLRPARRRRRGRGVGRRPGRGEALR